MKRYATSACILGLALATHAPVHAATTSWLDANGFWDDATKWDNGVPSAADSAIIDPGGTRTVTVRATGGPFFVDAITMSGDDTLSLAGGNLSINGSSVIANLRHNTGVLGGTGDILVTGTASLALSNLSSVMTGPGTTTLQGTSTVAGYAIDNGRILRNEGTLTLTGGINLNRFDDGGAGRIDNAVGAVFDIRTFNTLISASALADLNDRPGFPAFNNAGTLRRSSSGTYGISVGFNNTGTLDLVVGNLNLSGGGTHSGAATLAAGTSLIFGGGTHTVEAGATFAGAGTLQVSGNAIVDFAAATTIASAFNHNTGVLRGADLTLAGPTTLALSNLSVGMTGPGTTTLLGATSIGGYSIDDGRILRNEGTVTLTGGIELDRVNDGGAGRIDNAAGALFDIKTFNTSIAASARPDLGARPGFPAFNNDGTLRRSSSGTYTIAVPLNNTGTIELVQGNLNLSGGSAHAGTTLAANTSLGLVAGTHVVASGAHFIGDGTVSLAGAGTVLQLDAPSTFESNFSMTGGTIQGQDLTILGDATIAISSSLGVMAGAGTTVLKGSSLITGGVNNPFGLDGGRVLRNEGNAVITGVIEMNRLDTPGLGSGRLVNAQGGVIDVRTFNQGIVANDFGAQDAGLDALIENAGTFKKTTAGNYSIGVNFHNTGTVSVEAGSFTFQRETGNTGTLAVAAGAAMSFGSAPFTNEGALRGNGTYTFGAGTTTTNAGLLSPGFSVGSLILNGNVGQAASGVLEIELSSLADFDTIRVNGNLNLDGTLRILSLNGFNPQVGDTFTIATIDDGIADPVDLTGAFANLAWHGFSPGIGFSVAYLDHAIVLNAIPSAVPLPPALWLMLTGVTTLGAACTRRSSPAPT